MKTSFSFLLAIGIFFLFLSEKLSENNSFSTKQFLVENPPVLIYPPIKVSGKKVNQPIKKSTITMSSEMLLSDNRPPIIIIPPVKVCETNSIELGKLLSDNRPPIIVIPPVKVDGINSIEFGKLLSDNRPPIIVIPPVKLDGINSKHHVTNA